MKKVLKIVLCTVLCIVIGGLVIFSPYLMSFVKHSEDFDVAKGFSVMKNITIPLSKGAQTNNYAITDQKSFWFNYYGIEYTADCYVKGTFTYKTGVVDKTEEFFLEPAEKPTVFYSFIDDVLNKNRGNKVTSLTLETLTEGKGSVKINEFVVFNREIPQQEIFVETDTLKIGVDLLWGGALSYLEDLDSNVQAAHVDGLTKVDSNISDRYPNAEIINSNVNLINRNDTGRLIQQSYYGTIDYDHGTYMDNPWNYNPVQGGNQFNDASKIVDIKLTDNSIYIKCRPLDWAKEKEFITPSYMEATYKIECDAVHTKCRFVDFSGYPENEREQEIPAFYCIEPFNNFVYYAGKKPWTNGKLTSEPDLIFWPDAGYPKFYSKEHWAAFTGEFEDSFGMGVYVPGQEEFLAGVYQRETTTEEDPSKAPPTSYMAVIKTRTFTSFEPFSYEYYLATGNTQEIRDTFNTIENK